MGRDLSDELFTAIREGRSAEVNKLLTTSKLSKREMRDCLYGAVLYDHTNIATTLLNHSDFLPKEKRCPYLYMSALTGNLEITAALLEKVTEMDKFLAPFIMERAVRKSSDKVIDLILAKGISVDTKIQGELAAIHIAVEIPDLKLIEYLLNKGASTDARFDNNHTLLHHAVEKNQEAVVSLLLKHGAQVDAEAEDKSTPIYIAVEKGLVDVVRLLVHAGADVNAWITSDPSGDSVNHFPTTLLHIAAARGHQEVVKLLLESKADVDAVDSADKTPFHVAADADQNEVVKLFLSHSPTLGDLHSLAADGCAKNVETLLRCGASVDSRNANDRTPLFLAAKNNHDEVVKLLMKYGADINYKNEKGWTPLHFFAAGVAERSCECLLKCGAWVDPRDAKARTPLYFAAQTGQVGTLQLLLRHGADVDSPGTDGTTPLSVAASKGDTAKVTVLLKAGAKVRSKALESALYELMQNGREKIVSLLIQHGAKFSSRTANDIRNLNYSLYSQAGKGNVAIVKALLRSGADANSTLHPEKQTPLFAAAKFGHSQVIKLLLDSGAEVNQREMHGETPLLHTIPPEPQGTPTSGCRSCIKVLLEYGAQIDARDYSANGNSPLSIAAEKFWTPEVLQTLLEHGPIDSQIVRESNMHFLFYTINKYGPICHMVMGNIPSHGVSSAEILVRHTIKMKAAKLYTDTDNFKSNTFSKPTVLKSFLTKCEREVTAMRKVKIGSSNVTFYDVLTKSPYQVARFFKNDVKAEEALHSGSYKKKFPEYANNLSYQIGKGKVRNQLLKEGAKVLNPAIKRFADISVKETEKILDYLPNSDLRALIRAKDNS